MREYVRALSSKAEFLIVILVSFGYFILSSLLSVLDPGSFAHITEGHLRFLLIYESIVIVVLWKFLSVRGWHFQQLGLAPKLKDIGIGVALTIAVYVAHTAIMFVIAYIAPEQITRAGRLVAPDIGLASIFTVSILNAVFEEVFVCGYVITTLRKTHSVSFAINASIAIRLSYHLYQGTARLIGIFPIGLLFALWFARTGRLWPAIIAHCIIDIIGLVVSTRL